MDYSDDEEEGETKEKAGEKKERDNEQWSEGDDMDDEDVAEMMAMGDESGPSYSSSHTILKFSHYHFFVAVSLSLCRCPSLLHYLIMNR